MSFSSVPCQNCNDTVQYCKSLTHLTHLIKLCFWYLVCQMCHIIAFDTFKSSVVDALICFITIYYLQKRVNIVVSFNHTLTLAVPHPHSHMFYVYSFFFLFSFSFYFFLTFSLKLFLLDKTLSLLLTVPIGYYSKFSSSSSRSNSN